MFHDSIREAQNDFIKPKFLPTGGKIKEASKLQSHEANQLLEFWHQRQKDKAQPTFEFKGWQDHDKEMRKLGKISGCNSSAICSLASAKTMDLVKQQTSRSTRKSSRKPTRWVEQELSSESEDGDEGEGDEGVQSPPSKFRSVRKQGRAVHFDSEEDSCSLAKQSKGNHPTVPTAFT
ncbi:hypothetical protein BDR04DRAFT_1120273 [Suillus decipiens]|nr:hypothetical protein BDR04DRAFT_1120273 [Suillus decipiens]